MQEYFAITTSAGNVDITTVSSCTNMDAGQHKAALDVCSEEANPINFIASVLN